MCHVLLDLISCQVPADVKAKIESKVGDLKAVLTSEDAETMKTAMNALEQEVMKMGKAMYDKPSGEQQAGAAPGGASGKADDVIDAEFTE